MMLTRWLPLACCSVWVVKGNTLPAEAAQKTLSLSHPAPPSLLDITMDEVISLFESGTLTSVELVTVNFI
jgi:hypothetical protein